MRFAVYRCRPSGLIFAAVLVIFLHSQLLGGAEAKIVHKIVRNIAIPVIAGAGAGLAGGVVAGVVTGSHKNQPYHPVASYYAYRHSFSHRPPILHSLRQVLRSSLENRRSAYRLAHPAVYTALKEEPHVECKVVGQQSDAPAYTELHHQDEVAHSEGSWSTFDEEVDLDKQRTSHSSAENERSSAETEESDREFSKRQHVRKLRRTGESRKSKTVKKT